MYYIECCYFKNISFLKIGCSIRVIWFFIVVYCCKYRIVICERDFVGLGVYGNFVFVVGNFNF